MRYAVPRPLLPCLAALLAAPAASAQKAAETVAVPNRFEAGTRAVAREVNENFEALGGAIDADRTRLDAADAARAELSTRVTVVEDAASAAQQAAGAASAAAATNAGVLATLESQSANHATQLTAHDVRLDALEADVATVVRPANTIVVATEGGDFTSIAAALSSIQSSSLANPFLVEVHPGRYFESELSVVPAGVHLRGAGPQQSVLIAERSNFLIGPGAAAVQLLEDGRISGLGIQNPGVGASTVGILATNVSENTVLDDVRVEVLGFGGSAHVAVHQSGSMIVRRSFFEARGATSFNHAFAATGFGAFPKLIDCELIGRGADSGVALHAVQARPTVHGGVLLGENRGLLLATDIIRLNRCHVETIFQNPAFEASSTANQVICVGVNFRAGSPISGNRFYTHCSLFSTSPIADTSSPAAF